MSNSFFEKICVASGSAMGITVLNALSLNPTGEAVDGFSIFNGHATSALSIAIGDLTLKVPAGKELDEVFNPFSEVTVNGGGPYYWRSKV